MSAVSPGNPARKSGASWGPPAGNNRGDGDAADDGDRGGDNERAGRMGCKAPGWPPIGTRGC